LLSKENVMAEVILKMERAAKPEFTPRQVSFCKDLIAMGLSRLAIAALVLETDAAALNPSQVSSVQRLIQKQYKELGHNIVDARNARSPFMQDAIRTAARQYRLRVRIA
jgi:hypothetical protein